MFKLIQNLVTNLYWTCRCFYYIRIFLPLEIKPQKLQGRYLYFLLHFTSSFLCRSGCNLFAGIRPPTSKLNTRNVKRKRNYIITILRLIIPYGSRTFQWPHCKKFLPHTTVCFPSRRKKKLFKQLYSQQPSVLHHSSQFCHISFNNRQLQQLLVFMILSVMTP